VLSVRFSERFKQVWWVLLLVALLVLIGLRRAKVASGSLTALDGVILGVMAVLILMPFFSEVTLLGVSVKQKVEETKKELKQEIKDRVSELRAEVRNSITVSIGTPPADHELGTIKQMIITGLDQLPPVKAWDPAGRRAPPRLELTPLDEADMPPAAVEAVKARYQLEREAKRAWASLHAGQDPGRRAFRAVVQDLVEKSALPRGFDGLLAEAYSVVSAGAHGNEPTDAQLGFLRDVVPPLVERFRAIGPSE
jgi:hypothetical protein